MVQTPFLKGNLSRVSLGLHEDTVNNKGIVLKVIINHIKVDNRFWLETKVSKSYCKCYFISDGLPDCSIKQSFPTSFP